MTVPLLIPERRWYCPNCTVTTVSRDPRPHAPMHTCKGTHGLTTMMVQAGVRAEIVAVEREDYIGTDTVQLDPENGRPIMAVVAKRDDGEDRIINAPVATASVKVS